MLSPHSHTPLIEENEVNFNVTKERPLVLYTSVAIAAITSVLYGFHMSELNAPSDLIKVDLNLSDTQIGMVTSVFSIGGLISSSLSSCISQKYGLRMSFLLTLSFYCAGSLIEARAGGFTSLLVGRVVSGLGGGLAIVLVPLYVNSVSPAYLTGLLGSVTQVSVNFGILLTQLTASVLATESHWRRILDLGWIIAGAGLLLTYFALQESPRWLVLNVKNESLGLQTLSKFRNGDVNGAQLEIEEWKNEHGEQSKPIGFYQYLTDHHYSNSKIVATISMVGQQFSGINSVIFYGVSILNGLFPQWSIIINCLISLGNMLITFAASLFLDTLGRKPLLLTSLLLMSVACIGLFYGIYTNGHIITIVSIFTYVGSFAIGCGPIPFLLISEVSQSEVKSIAQGWATNCNWVSVFLIGTLFPIMNDKIGPFVYLLFGIIAILFAMFVSDFVPETKGKTTYASVWALDSRTE